VWRQIGGVRSVRAPDLTIGGGMYLHIQRLINEIEADEPDTATALQEGLGGPAPAPGRRRSTPPPAFKRRAVQLTASRACHGGGSVCGLAPVAVQD